MSASQDRPQRWAELALGLAAEAGDGSFWVAALRREERKVNAACRALGGLEYLTGPEFTGSSRTRLRRIREVVAELRDGLGMPPNPLNPTGAVAASDDVVSGGEAA
jgi:hypothetical protein